jgi:hypothetical protein
VPNCDLDSGHVTQAAEYWLADDTYAKLLAQLSDSKFDLTSPELHDNIRQFYSDLLVSILSKTDGDHDRPYIWAELKLTSQPEFDPVPDRATPARVGVVLRPRTL